MLARGLAGHSRHFGCEQVHDRAVLIRRPNGSVMSQETRTRALFTSEAKGTVKQARSKPFESHRHFAQSPTEFARYAINNAATDQRFAYRHVRSPMRAIGEQVTNCHSKEMVGVHQTRTGRAGIMPV